MTSYQVDTIYYNDQGEIVFNNSDVEGENENTTVDLSNYVEKKGDVMTGALTVPQLNFVNDGSSQQTAFTEQLKQNVISNTVKTTEMSFSDNITYFWKPVQMEAELILQDGSVLVGMDYNSNTTQIGYDSVLEKTTISKNTFINNLTCGNINTADLTSTTSNLQAQINSLQGQITLLNSTIKASIPVGSIMIYSSDTIPTGFLLCDGTLVSRTTYSALFAVIGETYRATASTTSFYLPDLRQCYVKGAGTNTTYTNSMKITVPGANTATFQQMSVQNHTHT